MAPARDATKRETLNIRIKAEDRALIDRAAQLAGRTRTDFVVHAARKAAEEEILDRTLFKLGPKAYAEFLARLDAPPNPNQRLVKALKKPLPWK